MGEFDDVNSAYAFAQKLKQERKEAAYEPPPTEDDAKLVLCLLKKAAFIRKSILLQS